MQPNNPEKTHAKQPLDKIKRIASLYCECKSVNRHRAFLALQKGDMLDVADNVNIVGGGKD